MKEHIEGLSKEYGWRTRERGLVTSLMHGIGYMHEGLSNKERDGLMELFESGAVQVDIERSRVRFPLVTFLFRSW